MMMTNKILCWVSVIVVSSTDSDDWKLADRYPQHYVTHKLRGGEKITIDGRLDDAASRRSARAQDVLHAN